MKQHTLRFAKFAVSAALCAVTLAACSQTDSNRKASAPIPAGTVALMESKGVKPSDPVLMRVVKADSKLEVWKKSSETGKYTFLKSYEICKWSGDLGPKKSEGDRQAPEGFYEITPAQMNPNSSYYLSFNTGFPNAYDRAYNRSGSHLMVHGDCSSRGCYAMTDENIGEIYAIAREALRGGQKSFQLQALPFQMTAKNMYKFRNSPHYSFWQNIKEGVDQFEVSGLEPKVDVCNKKYVFNAQTTARFEASATCPAYSLPKDIEVAYLQKKAAYTAEMQALMQEELYKVSSPKLASLIGMQTSANAKIDPVISAKSISKDAARPHLPSSSPEAVSLLAYHHNELPADVETTASVTESKPIVKASTKSASSKANSPKQNTNASAEPVEKIALMSPDAYLTPSMFQIAK